MHHHIKAQKDCVLVVGWALYNNQPIVLAALLLLDNSDNFNKESKVGGATTTNAEREVDKWPTGTERGQGDDNDFESNDGRYATLPPLGQSVQKEQTWKVGWGASTMLSPPARLDLRTGCRGQRRLRIGLGYCLVGYNWWCSYSNTAPTHSRVIDLFGIQSSQARE